jgi:hypothetical protein
MDDYGEPVPPPPESRGRGGVLKPGKAETVRRLHSLKRRIAVLTVLGFGALSGLVAGHHVGAAAQSSPAAPAATTVPAPSTDQGDGFFDQQGKDEQGGYGYCFGTGDAQGPVAGSGAS